MTDRSLAALGYDTVPALAPLSYPGRPVTSPALLYDGELWELTPRPGPPGDWPVRDPHRPAARAEPLDSVLSRLGLAPLARRHPVLAIGSNASPAQLHHKLTATGRPTAVPMVPVELRGVGIGCSAHIARYGYLACAPYEDPEATCHPALTWLDTVQLAVVDATEPNYGRIPLSGERCPVTLPSGERLDAAYLYASVRGLLAKNGESAAQSRGEGARPLPGGGPQGALLDGLLARSARLRELFGPDAGSWVRRAGADPALREAGTRAFHEEGWVLPPAAFPCPSPDGNGEGRDEGHGHGLLSSSTAEEPPARRLSS